MAAAEAPGRSVLAEIFSPHRIGTLLTVAAMIAVAAGAWMWSRTPDYRVLFSNVSDRDGGAIVAGLQQMNVPYRFAEGSGVIQVPSTHVHEARLRLAAQGLPRGSLVGFEIMENPKLGTSQFLEQVNYQRALEGELARSIQSLAAVQGARVHLALSRATAFVREHQKPSASVVLGLHAGRTLDPTQVSAIVHLVASSVPDLPVRNVTVIDQHGNLLSGQGQQPRGSGLDSSQLKYVHDLEGAYVKRIEAILAPILGGENVRAQVAAEIDFSETERAEETHKPNQEQEAAAIRSRQTSESQTASGAQSGGVPGALSNQPPAAATAPVAAAATTTPGTPGPAASGAPPLTARKDATINYEVDRTIRHVRQPLGGIKRLSVAVVVNHRKETDAKGKASFKPLPQEDLAQITSLVKEAVGYSQARGDTLSVANAPFNTPEKVSVPETPLWKQPGTIAIAQEVGKHLLIAALALYLVLGVLRPLLRSLAQRAAAAAEAGAAVSVSQALQQRSLSYDQNLEAARSLARQEPKLVANVVKNWVAGNE